MMAVSLPPGHGGGLQSGRASAGRLPFVDPATTLQAFAGSPSGWMGCGRITAARDTHATFAPMHIVGTRFGRARGWPWRPTAGRSSVLRCSCDRVRLAGTHHCVTSCAAHVLLRAWCPIKWSRKDRGQFPLYFLSQTYRRVMGGLVCLNLD